MPEFIINKLLAGLTGVDYWIAAIFFVVGLSGWYYFGKTKKLERKTAKHQLWIAGLSVVVGIAGIGAHHLFFDSDFTFSEDVAGILVLRIEGDDENNSLQRLLVSSLNNSIRKEAAGQKIEVRIQNEIVTESMGLSQAHKKAREIGKTCKAILVIWGNRVGDKAFFPRLTVAGDKYLSIKSGQWTLAAQDITELALPPAQVDQPIYLTYFVTGYAFYNCENYASALAQFKAALNQAAINPIELNEIRIYSGLSHWYLAQGQREMASHLQQAIAYYDTALSFYTEQGFAEQWARTQNNLGTAYALLPTGTNSENLQKAIAFYEAALRIYTEKDFPANWALIQNNLGKAYCGNLPAHDSNANLQKAIAFYEAALRVRTEKDFPVDWASTQENLGYVYAYSNMSDRGENRQKAIAYYEAALRVYTEKDFPEHWARAQKNLGDVYAIVLGNVNAYSGIISGLLPGARRNTNLNTSLQKAVIAYEAALRVYTEKDFPKKWADTQNSLGAIYAVLPTGDRIANLQKAITACEAVLRVYTEKDSPENWARTQLILGAAYLSIPNSDSTANVKKAISACEAALRVYTEKDSVLWASTQIILGIAYATLTTSDPKANAKKAIASFEAALRVYTEKDSVSWAYTQFLLGAAYSSLPTSDSNATVNKAITALEAALRVYTEEDYPMLWAMAQIGLGSTYMELSTGSRNSNLQRAIACFENALRICTAEAFPEFHQEAIDNLKGAQTQLQNLAKK